MSSTYYLNLKKNYCCTWTFFFEIAKISLKSCNWTVSQKINIASCAGFVRQKKRGKKVPSFMKQKMESSPRLFCLTNPVQMPVLRERQQGERGANCTVWKKMPRDLWHDLWHDLYLTSSSHLRCVFFPLPNETTGHVIRTWGEDDWNSVRHFHRDHIDN
jgi:hypothetical protein